MATFRKKTPKTWSLNVLSHTSLLQTSGFVWHQKREREKEERGRKRQECLAMAFKSLGVLCWCSGNPVIFQSLAEARQLHQDRHKMHGRRLVVTNWIIPWAAWCISKPLPDTGITSTECCCWAQLTAHPWALPPKPEIQAKPKSRRFGSESGHQHSSAHPSSPSQQCQVNLPLLGYYKPIVPGFLPQSFTTSTFHAEHMIFCWRKIKNRIVFLGLEKFFSLTDGFFLELVSKYTLHLPRHQRQG